MIKWKTEKKGGKTGMYGGKKISARLKTVEIKNNNRQLFVWKSKHIHTNDGKVQLYGLVDEKHSYQPDAEIPLKANTVQLH
jgi:hypothetical protein